MDGCGWSGERWVGRVKWAEVVAKGLGGKGGTKVLGGRLGKSGGGVCLVYCPRILGWGVRSPKIVACDKRRDKAEWVMKGSVPSW